MRRLLPLLGILLAAAPGSSQEKTKPYPDDVALQTTMEEVAAWPEFRRVVPTVPRLEKAADELCPLGVPQDVPVPRLHGAAVSGPALERARSILVALMPETANDSSQWHPQVDLRPEVTEEFSIGLARRIIHPGDPNPSWSGPYGSVIFRVREGVAVPVQVSLSGRDSGEWVPKEGDREPWERLATELYQKAFGEQPFGEKAEMGRLHAGDVEVHWGDRWEGLRLPRQMDASAWLHQVYSDKMKWSIVLHRGLDSVAIAGHRKGLSDLRFKVTGREAVAIAARNWQAAWPDQSQGVAILGASFGLFGAGNLGGHFIGGINRCTYYSDPEAAKRLKGGEALLATWRVSLHRAGWYDHVTIWVAADSGRVTKIYGAQGLGRR